MSSRSCAFKLLTCRPALGALSITAVQCRSDSPTDVLACWIGLEHMASLRRCPLPFCPQGSNRIRVPISRPHDRRPLAEVATSARLTCLVHASPGPPPAKQQAPAQRPRPAKEAAQQPRAAKPSAKQQRQQQPESEQPAQPKAKQKIKLKAKHQGGREAAPSTKQPLEQPASGTKQSTCMSLLA